MGNTSLLCCRASEGEWLSASFPCVGIAVLYASYFSLFWPSYDSCDSYQTRSQIWSQVRTEYAVVTRVMFALLIAYQRSQHHGDHLLRQVSDPFTPTGILFPGMGRPCSVPKTHHLHQPAACCSQFPWDHLGTIAGDVRGAGRKGGREKDYRMSRWM